MWRSGKAKRAVVAHVIVLVKLVLFLPCLLTSCTPIFLLSLPPSPALLPYLPPVFPQFIIISLCAPPSSITLSHRFPSYYRGICLHLSKNKTHTHIHAYVHSCAFGRQLQVCSCVPGELWDLTLFFCRLECLGLGLPHHTEPVPQPGQRSEHQQIWAVSKTCTIAHCLNVWIWVTCCLWKEKIAGQMSQ